MTKSIDIRPDSDLTLGHFNCNPLDIGFFALIREDYICHDCDFFSQGFWALAVHRFGNWRMGLRYKVFRAPCTLLYFFLDKLVEWFCGISLKYTVRVGRRVRIWHQGGMVLGALSIGDDVHIRQNTTFGVRRRGDPRWLKPTIEDGCDIGAGAVIVGGIVVGARSRIGANVVLGVSVPPDSVVLCPRPQIFTDRLSDEDTSRTN